jgi:hypothetical protein
MIPEPRNVVDKIHFHFFNSIGKMTFKKLLLTGNDVQILIEHTQIRFSKSKCA